MKNSQPFDLPNIRDRIKKKICIWSGLTHLLRDVCELGCVFVPPVPNIDVGKNFAGVRGGSGMKNQVLFGYQVFRKIKYGSSRV